MGRVRVYVPRLRWRPIQHPGLSDAQARAVESRIEAFFDDWVDTPYVPGLEQRGVGVDCVRLAEVFLDHMYGFDRERIPRHAQDMAEHDPTQAEGVVRKLLAIYAPNQEVTDGTIEPGDLISTASTNGGPAHGMIVGARENHIWHANSKRVKRSGLGFARRFQDHLRVYRQEDKDRWALQ